MRKLFLMASLIAAVGLSVDAGAQTAPRTSPPTIVLVHGAFADSSSWNGVISLCSGRTAFRRSPRPIRCGASRAMPAPCRRS